MFPIPFSSPAEAVKAIYPGYETDYILVVERSEVKKSRAYMRKCKCKGCNEELLRMPYHIRNGKYCTKCTNRKMFETGNTKRLKHGLYKAPEYQVRQHMKDRCYNESCKHYKNYGGRGITVCGHWLESFDNFYKDMGARPNKEYSIERIDNDGGYNPANCKRATRQEQNMNKRTSKKNKPLNSNT